MYNKVKVITKVKVTTKVKVITKVKIKTKSQNKKNVFIAFSFLKTVRVIPGAS